MGVGGRRQTPQMSPDFMTLLHQYSKGPVEVVFQNKKIENFENLKKSFSSEISGKNQKKFKNLFSFQESYFFILILNYICS